MLVSLRHVVACAAAIASIAGTQAAAQTIPASSAGYQGPSIAVEGTTRSTSAGIGDIFGVLDRSRPEYDAVGLRVGGFTLYPSIVVGAAFDDNVFATSVRKADDYVGRIQPEFVLRSNWSSHSLRLHGSADAYWHEDNTSEDRVNARAGFSGHFDVTSTTRVRYLGDWFRDHEDRAVSSQSNAGNTFLNDEPIRFDVLNAGISVDQRFNRVTVTAGVLHSHVDYQNVTSNGSLLDQGFRDVDLLNSRLRLSYQFGPVSQVFVEGSYETRDYARPGFDGDGYRAIGGLSGELTRLVRGEVYSGYLVRNYDRAAVQDIDSWTYGGALSWFVTPIVTVSAFGERSINDTEFGGQIGSFIQSRVGARVDYELRRNVILSGRAGYEWNDYTASIRADEILVAGTSVTYLLSRNAHLSLDYRYTDRTSNFSEVEYDRNQVGLNLKLQY